MIAGFWLVFIVFNIPGWAGGYGSSSLGSQPFCRERCNSQVGWAGTGCDCAAGATEAPEGSNETGRETGREMSRLCEAYCAAATEPQSRVLVESMFKNRALMCPLACWGAGRPRCQQRPTATVAPLKASGAPVPSKRAALPAQKPKAARSTPPRRAVSL